MKWNLSAFCYNTIIPQILIQGVQGRDLNTIFCKIKNHKAGLWQSDWTPLSFWDDFGNLEEVQIFAKSLFSIQNNLEIIPVTWMILMYTCKKYINW